MHFLSPAQRTASSDVTRALSAAGSSILMSSETLSVISVLRTACTTTTSPAPAESMSELTALSSAAASTVHVELLRPLDTPPEAEAEVDALINDEDALSAPRPSMMGVGAPLVVEDDSPRVLDEGSKGSPRPNVRV